MEIGRQQILKQFFIRFLCSHHKIFAESISQGNIGWKIISFDRTCTHNGSAATFGATCHIKKIIELHP
jgi:hypothetical protein